MRVLKKLTIGELQNDSNEILERERMKAIKGGGGGCYMYCADGSMAITNDCTVDTASRLCGPGIHDCYGAC